VTWLRSTGLRLLLSIGLAFSLWVFVSFTQNPEQRSSFDSVPVDIEGLAPDLLVVDQQGLPRANRPAVDITVEGDEQTVQQVHASDLRAFVDLSGRGAGEYNNVPVSVVPNRSGLARLRLSPDPAFLSFRLDQEITRTVPLTIAVTGNVPFSFESSPARLTYQSRPITSVEVRGPQNRVDRVALARVTADIDRLTANYSSPRPVEALAQDGQVVTGVTVEPASVDVLVPIGSSAGIKRVPVVPQLVGAPASGYIVTNLSADPQFVRLTGGSGSLDGVSSIETGPVEIAGASRTITRAVELRVPENTGLASGEPNVAVVTVQIAPITRPFQVTVPAPVQVVDIPDGLLVSLSPQVVQITLTGSAAQVSTLDPTAIQGTVSVRGRGPGTYTIEPAFQLPAGIALAGTPPKVTVTLRPPPTEVPAATPTGEAPTRAAEPTAAPAATPTTAAPTTISELSPTPAATPAPTAAP